MPVIPGMELTRMNCPVGGAVYWWCCPQGTVSGSVEVSGWNRRILASFSERPSEDDRFERRTALHVKKNSLNLGVGLRLLDRDHREIKATIFELNQDASEHREVGRQIALLRQLERVMCSHFALEEGLMCAAQFPGYSAHQIRHQWMMERVRRTISWLGHPVEGTPMQAVTSLDMMHEAHVGNDDRSLEDWLGWPAHPSGRITGLGRNRILARLA